MAINHKGKIKGKNNGIKVIECIKCGFMHQYPLPKQKYLNDFYKNKYFQTNQKGYYKKQRSQKEYLDFCNCEKERFLRDCIEKNTLSKFLR